LLGNLFQARIDGLFKYVWLGAAWVFSSVHNQWGWWKICESFFIGLVNRGNDSLIFLFQIGAFPKLSFGEIY
jgi:hypothetical protein